MNHYKTLLSILKTVPPKGLKDEYISHITDKQITIVGADLQTITFEFDKNGKLIHWEQKGLTMEDYTTYTAHAIINIWDIDIKIDIPFLEEKCEYLDLREIILEYVNESLYIKSFNYTEDED